MFKKLKFLLLGLFFGVLLGLWFGVNIGRDRPLYANPFTEPGVQERMKGAMDKAYDDTKQSLREALDE